MPQKELTIARADKTQLHKASHEKGISPGPNRSSVQISAPAIQDAEPSFTIDRNGDFQNVKYGESDRYKVPRYHSSGRGSLIGLHRHYKVIQAADRTCEVRDGSLDSSRRVNEALLSTIDTTDEPLLRSSLEYTITADDVTTQRDYINLGHKRRRTSCSSTNSDPEVSNDGDPRLNGEENVKLSSYNRDLHHRRNMQLQERITTNPQDVAAWWQLADLQEHLVIPEDVGSDHKLNAREKRIASQLRLSVLETATDRVTNQTSKDLFLLAIMKEGSKNWDSSEQRRRWQELLKKDPSFDLEMEYINWLQSTGTGFSMNSCLNSYKTLLSKYMRLCGTDSMHNAKCCHILLRLTTFLSEAGFRERAIGIWQANLEFNMFKPEDLRGKLPEDALQDFWNSERVRIGEEGAKGWNASSHVSAPIKHDPESTGFQRCNQLQLWAEAEVTASRVSSLPARTLDEVSDTDPFRIVLFDDIRDFTFQCCGESRGLLVQAFLHFCTLPYMLNSNYHEARKWCADPYLTSCEQLTINARNPPSGTSASLPTISSTANLTSDELASWSIAAITLIASKHIDTEYGEALAELVMTLQSYKSPEKVHKAAKSFLKKRPESMYLYNAYALMECRTGNFEAAQRAWEAVLTIPVTVGASATKLVLWNNWIYELLHRSKFSHAMDLFYKMTKRTQDAADLEMDLPGNLSSKSLSDIKQHLDSTFATILKTRNVRQVAACANLIAIFSYLSNSRDLAQLHQAYCSAILTVRSFASGATHPSWNTDKSILDELLHENFARLIDLHTEISQPGAVRPKEIVEMLLPLRMAYSENTVIWSISRHHLRRAGIIERLRDIRPGSIFATKATPHPSGEDRDSSAPTIMTPLLEIAAELERPSSVGSTQHNVRAAFKRGADAALSDAHVALHRSSAFWIQYLSWEISQIKNIDATSDKSKHKSKKHHPAREALSVFYAAISACPGVKQLYLLALSSTAIVDAMGYEAALGVYDMMLDRGLRIRIELSD